MPLASSARPLHPLERLEWVAAGLGCAVLLALHAPDVRWGPFVLLFAAVDLLGYLPGAVLARRGAVPRWAFALYNLAHSALTHVVVVGLWWAVAGRPEWALLALPLHLACDRGLLGNGLKSPGEPFTPGSRAVPARPGDVALPLGWPLVAPARRAA